MQYGTIYIIIDRVQGGYTYFARGLYTSEQTDDDKMEENDYKDCIRLMTRKATEE